MVALKTLVFSIVIPGTVTVIIPWLLLQGTGGLVLPGPSLWMVGLLPLLLGVGLSVWCAGAFTFIGRNRPKGCLTHSVSIPCKKSCELEKIQREELSQDIDSYER